MSSPISAGTTHYAIISDRGDLYLGGLLEIESDGSLKIVTDPASKMDLAQAVIDVSCHLNQTSVVLEDGTAYFLNHEKFNERPHSETRLIDKTPVLDGKVLRVKKMRIFSDRRFIQILDDNKIHLRVLGGGSTILPDEITATDAYVTDDNGQSDQTHLVHLLDLSGNICVYQISSDLSQMNLLRKMEFPSKIKKFRVDNGNHMALDYSGKVYTWDVRDTSQYSQVVPKPLNFSTKMVDMDLYDGTYAVVDEEGSITMWGNNGKSDSGRISDADQLMDENDGGDIIFDIEENKLLYPTTIQGYLSNLRPDEDGDYIASYNHVAIGGMFTIATTTDGKVQLWGIDGMAPEV